MTTDKPMTLAEGAAFLKAERTTVYRWKALLGDPVDPDARPLRYSRSDWIRVGKLKGYLDGQGRPVQREQAKGRGRSIRHTVPPAPSYEPGTRRLRYWVPDIAAMLGVKEVTVHAWVSWANREDREPENPDVKARRRLKPDGHDGQYPYWFLSTLKVFAKREGLELDENAPRR